MANITFENLLAQIAAGTITAAEIQQYPCTSISAQERQALLIALSDKALADAAAGASSLASVQSGILAGGVDVTLVVPAFLTGNLQVVDTDNSARHDLSAPHQFVTDTTGEEHPEESTTSWGAVDGKHYAGRTFTILSGMTILYSFVLKD